MENVTKLKVVVFAVLGYASARMGILFMPVILMCVSSVIDYITGLMASYYNNVPISSYRSMRGIIKKVAYWLLVPVGMIMDCIIDFAINTAGITFNWEVVAKFDWPWAIACLIALWVAVSECISIKENVRAIDVDVPEFVDKVQEGMLDTVERAILKESGERKETAARMEDDLK